MEFIININNVLHFISENSTIIASLITFLASVIVATLIKIPASNKQTIHGESNWRSELLKLCSVEIVTNKELLQLRSFVNPFKKPNQYDDLGKIVYDLDNMIIDFCQRYYGKINSKNVDEISFQFRMIARTLLKYDWNYSKYNNKRAKKENKKLVDNLRQCLIPFSN